MGETKIRPSKMKILPQNKEAERALLGALLIDNDSVIKVADFLKPKHFYHPTHKIIYDAILSLFNKVEPVDLITVTSELKKNKKLKSVGGASFLAELTEAVPTASHVKHYGKEIYDHAVKRELISFSSRLSESGFDESVSSQDLIELAESSVFSAFYRPRLSAFGQIRSTLEEEFDRLDELQKDPSKLRGVPTGIKLLDDKIGGLQRANMIVLAARPSLGKTSLALNAAQHAAVKHKIPVGIFSLETSKSQLVRRLLSAQADIDSWKLNTGKLDENDYKNLGNAMGVLSETPIFIDDTPALSVMEMRSRARRIKMEHDIQLLVVDYIQLAQGTRRYNENRVQEVSEISQSLKNLAKELDIPVLAISQLSRAVESRGTSRPQLSDLRESGAIEQDADIVMFLYREEPDERENVQLFVAKHRNGPTGEFPLFFRGERTKFYEEADASR